MLAIQHNTLLGSITELLNSFHAINQFYHLSLQTNKKKKRCVSLERPASSGFDVHNLQIFSPINVPEAFRTVYVNSLVG